MSKANRTLSGSERAAVLLMSLGESDAAAVLKLMDPREVERVGTAMAALNGVSGEQVSDVMDQFAEAIDVAVPAASLVYAPAGIGGHEDHVIVRDIALDLGRRSGMPVRLYAELPYAIRYGWPAWVTGAASEPARLEAGARRFALTLGRSLELAYLCAHAQWCLDHGRGPRSAAAARRFAQHGVDQLTEVSADDAKLLVR